MFQLGELFVAFTGKDAGLKQALKTAESLGKTTGRVMETVIKEGARLGVPVVKGFAQIAAASIKASATVSKSMEKIAASGFKAAGRITPAFLRSFDKLTGNMSKMSIAGLKSFTTLGKSGANLAGKIIGPTKGISGAMSALTTGATAAAGSIVSGFTTAAGAVASVVKAATMGVAALAALVVGAGVLVGMTLSLASSTKEMGGKFDVVFGKSAPAAEKKLGDLAAAMGRSKNDMKEMASGVQDLLVPIGIARDKAAGMAVSISQLAVDMASFNNKSDAETMDDITSALAGSGEVMKKYGVILNETTLKQELAKMGYHGAAEGASEQMKALARLNIIIAGTTDAHGDAVRTGGGFANIMKRIMGVVKDIGITIGQIFLPAAEVFAQFFANQLGDIRGASKDWLQYSDVLKVWAENIVLWLNRAITLFVNWREISTEAFNIVAAVARTSLDAIITMLDNVEIFLLNMFGKIIDFFPILFSSIAEVHGGIWSFLKKGWGEVWAFISSGGQDAIQIDFDKIVKDMKGKFSSLDYKPIQTGEALKEWERLIAVVDSKMKKAAAPPQIDKIKAFTADDAGIANAAGKTIKFEMVNAADLFANNLKEAFDEDNRKQQLEFTKKGVEVAEAGVAATEKVISEVRQTRERLANVSFIT